MRPGFAGRPMSHILAVLSHHVTAERHAIRQNEFPCVRARDASLFRPSLGSRSPANGFINQGGEHAGNTQPVERRRKIRAG